MNADGNPGAEREAYSQPEVHRRGSVAEPETSLKFGGVVAPSGRQRTPVPNHLAARTLRRVHDRPSTMLAGAAFTFNAGAAPQHPG